jgi:hypothetical protein
VRAGAPAVVATVGDEVVGTVVATVSGARALVLRISLAAGWRQRGIGSVMLTELERRLVAAGVHRVSCLLAGRSSDSPASEPSRYVSVLAGGLDNVAQRRGQLFSSGMVRVARDDAGGGNHLEAGDQK